MKKQILLGLAAVLAVGASFDRASAFTDVCMLANSEVPGTIRVSSLELASYKEKLKAECELSEKYQQMSRKAEKFGITLEQISEYQALRFIDRYRYQAAATRGIPVPLIYQISPDDDDKENSLRSSIVWDNFSLGIRQLGVERERVVQGGKFQLADFLRIHKGFYQLSDEVDPKSRRANPPVPGVMKSPSPNDSAWWPIADADLAKTRAAVDDMNRTFATFGLVDDDGYTGLRDQYEGVIHSVRQTADGKWTMHDGDSRSNVAHMNRLFGALNFAVAQARSGQHIVFNGRLLTPGEMALLFQQEIVAMHPMHDGNGRMSRFVQELVLSLFSLPAGASGDLMDNDVLTPIPEYYTKAITATRALLSSVDTCLEKAYAPEPRGGGRTAKGESAPPRDTTPVNAAALNQSQLEYRCRILPR